MLVLATICKLSADKLKRSPFEAQSVSGSSRMGAKLLSSAALTGVGHDDITTVQSDRIRSRRVAQ